MTLVWAKALCGFVYIANQKEIVVLNGELDEVSRWPGCDRNRLSEYAEEKNVIGSILCCHDFFSRTLRRCDLHTGAMTETVPELPAHVIALLPDGRFLGVNEKQNRLAVFDPSGTVVSRHTLAGTLTRVRCDGYRVLLLENRPPDTHSFVSDELFDVTSFHVWQLDPTE